MSSLNNKTRDEILAALPENAWTMAPLQSGEDYIRSWTQVDIAGELTTVWRTQYLADDDLQEVNSQERNDSDGTRWGDGKVVARIPLNVLFDPKREIAAKLKEGDRDHMKWFLNSDDAKPFRTRNGKI